MADKLKPGISPAPADPFSIFPNPELFHSPSAYKSPPNAQTCFELWDKYQMLPNIREHSSRVAHIAHWIATAAADKGFAIHPQTVMAAGLLHDLAKTWCLGHRGNHAMLGAAWVVAETGNYEIAQGVILHVSWPWQLPQGEKIIALPILIQYADKRVRHNQCVSLAERFDDLIARYGKTEKARTGMRATFQQARKIEEELSRQLKCNLETMTFA